MNALPRAFGASFLVAAVLSLPAWGAPRSVQIDVHAQTELKAISPYLFGRNVDVIDEKTDTLSAAETAWMNQVVEAGLHMIRANHGNNATRYNFRQGFTVHPDWFNNVNVGNWDISARKILGNMPGVDAMYAFQLTGYVAKTRDYNFGDWDWYLAHDRTWPSNRNANLAGGGEIADDGATVLREGDPSLYNMEWPADSTVAIVPYWRDELGFDMDRLRYWSMDNEPEIWRSTHDDLDLPVDADFIVARYVETAKKARAKWPGIKLTGPVSAGEWDWCVLHDVDTTRLAVYAEGKNWCWMEYFLKRVAEEQQRSGVRLIDMVDIHWYPQERDYETRVNWHRALYDTAYVYPGANGIKMVHGSWDNSQTKEYIFKRISDWLDQYFGEGHGIGLGMTETNLRDDDAMTTALVYASFLGTMADHGVEFFTPWSWDPGMYEVAHLFSRYGKRLRVESVSADDSLLSAYASVNAAGGDSLVAILVNRSAADTLLAAVRISQFDVPNGDVKTLTLSGLSGETFVSHAQNALRTGGVSVRANRFELAMPPKTIAAVLLSSSPGGVSRKAAGPAGLELFARGREVVARGVPSGSRWTLFDLFGRPVAEGTWNGAPGSELRVTVPSAGRYLFRAGGEVHSVGAI
ncbi:MAG: glycoside hydrolase [Fibrobacterales bacterium]|nr:glycoside hydrolase [Fibrobacterales bacterium]